MTFWQSVWANVRLGLAACMKREGLAIVALCVSVVGAAVLTGLLVWSMRYLQLHLRHDAIENLAYGLLATVAIVIFSMHRLLAGRQAIEAEFWKLKVKMSQGDGEPEGEAK